MLTIKEIKEKFCTLRCELEEFEEEIRKTWIKSEPEDIATDNWLMEAQDACDDAATILAQFESEEE